MKSLDGEKFRERYLAGITVHQLALEFGCCDATIQRTAKALKLVRSRVSQVRDITGQRFGRLITLRFERFDRFGKALWLTRCDCGKEKILNASALVAGLTKSCGCLKSERLRQGVGNLSQAYWRKVEKAALQRGLEFAITKTQAYALFQQQHGICALSGVPIELYPNQDRYQLQTASLDRIDSSRGYTPDNIQWVHKRVNFLKRDYTETELVFWCTKIAERKQALYQDISANIPKETRRLNESIESREVSGGISPLRSECAAPS